MRQGDLSAWCGTPQSLRHFVLDYETHMLPMSKQLLQQIRRETVDFIEAYLWDAISSEFSDFTTFVDPAEQGDLAGLSSLEAKKKYASNMRLNGTYGTELELQAMARIYNLCFYIKNAGNEWNRDPITYKAPPCRFVFLERAHDILHYHTFPDHTYLRLGYALPHVELFCK